MAKRNWPQWPCTVANDRAMAVIGNFVAGNIGEQTALVLLKPQKPDDQHVFIIHPALANLRESAPV